MFCLAQFYLLPFAFCKLRQLKYCWRLYWKKFAPLMSLSILFVSYHIQKKGKENKKVTIAETVHISCRKRTRILFHCKHYWDSTLFFFMLDWNSQTHLLYFILGAQLHSQFKSTLSFSVRNFKLFKSRYINFGVSRGSIPSIYTRTQPYTTIHKWSPYHFTPYHQSITPNQSSTQHKRHKIVH